MVKTIGLLFVIFVESLGNYMATLICILSFFDTLVDLFKMLIEFADMYPWYFLGGVIAIVFCIWYIAVTWKEPPPKGGIVL